MAIRLKLYAGFIGLIGAAINTSSMAERSVQLGLVASANSSFYKGVDEEYFLLPLMIAEYDRFYLQGTHGGFRFFKDDNDQSLALELSYTFDGYKSSDSDALRGMDDRDPAWEAGLVYEVGLAGGQAQTKLMQDVSGRHKGFSAGLQYERPFWTDDGLVVSWYARSEYWNSKKTDYYFGVSREEATSSRSFYAADKSYRFYLGSNVSKRINDNISLIASAEYLRMSVAANDSPLTDRQDQWSAYAGVFYQF